MPKSVEISDKSADLYVQGGVRPMGAVIFARYSGRVFLPLQEFGSVYSKKIALPFPLGHWTSAFAHRNPPRSLWLQHIHRMCCLTRRAHLTQIGDNRLFKHSSFVKGELGTHIDKCRTLIMPLRFVCPLRNNTAQSLVLSVELGAQMLAALRLEALNKYIPLIRTP